MRCGNGKMRCENGENAVRKWRNCGVFSACTCLISCIFVANVAKWWCDCSGFYVLFRRLQCLFAVKMRCGNGKMRCENGENAVRKRQNCGVFAVCTCLISCISVAKVAKWWCDCGGFHVLFRCLQGLFAVKMQCENGEMRCGNVKIVVRRWWLGFAISAEIHCVTAVAWCVSGVSNPYFPNFTKHSTVLTSILQQISILYQHFPSAKTALPALEQAKTMLKIALPTFKNDENHTQNSVCEVRCGKNAVLWRRFHD